VIVLDASTVLTTLLTEDGHDSVDSLMATRALAMSAVNVGEVHERLLAANRSLADTRAMIDSLQLQIIPVDRRIAELAAILRQGTRERGLGIADRVCIATGMLHEARIFTADRAWEGLDIPEADITVVR
jgi:PIN domain nuclease of toxin-antitoxin system